MDDVFARYRAALEKGHQAVIDGRPRQALAHYEEAAALAGERALPHVLIGGLLLRTGRVNDALVAYDRALERAPEDVSALSGKAAALLSAGRREEAQELAARIEEAEQRDAEHRKDAAAAAMLREAGRSGALSRPEVLHFAGEQARLAGRRDAAIQAWLESAAAYADAGHLDAALDSCQRALLAAPASPRVHLAMSRLYLLRGWPERAAERMTLIGRLLELEPDAELSASLRALAAENATADTRLAALAKDDSPTTS